MRRIVFTLLFVCLGLMGTAQTKTGTFDTDFVLSKMPELTKVQEDLNAYKQTLEKQLNEKADAYKKLVEAYKTSEATMSDADKKTKQQEIITLEGEIGKFQQNGAGLVQLRQDELLRPLYQKIGVALNEIAKSTRI